MLLQPPRTLREIRPHQSAGATPSSLLLRRPHLSTRIPVRMKVPAPPRLSQVILTERANTSDERVNQATVPAQTPRRLLTHAYSRISFDRPALVRRYAR